MSTETTALRWAKSSYSNSNGGGCVEWAPSVAATGTVPVRDSKQTSGPVLSFGAGAFATFVDAVKRDGLPTA